MGENKQNLKLTIELVPETSFFNNIREYVSQEEWDIIRKKSYSESNHKCAICGAKGTLNCHEIWDYDDKNYIQKLVGFIALCKNCHSIKHIGFTKLQANKGLLKLSDVIEHFCIINECNIEKFKEHHDEAFEKWSERSEHDWKVDFGDYTEIIQKNLKE